MTQLFTLQEGRVRHAREIDDVLAAQVERHIAEAHPDPVGKLSRDDVLAEIRAKATKEDVGAMRLISVNVGLPRTVRWKGRDVTTGIFKEPVEGRIPLRCLNLDGDRQADLSVHGGAAKAVYAYPLEHYAFWQEELREELPIGAFGENLTVEGLPLEEEVAVGDRFRIGTAELVVTQPRVPCYKLGLRFGRSDMPKRFLASRRTGYYLAVEVEGEVGAGDQIEVRARHPERVPVAELIRVYASDRDDLATIERFIAFDALPEDWRRYFQKKLAEKIATTPPRSATAAT